MTKQEMAKTLFDTLRAKAVCYITGCADGIDVDVSGVRAEWTGFVSTVWALQEAGLLTWVQADRIVSPVLELHERG